MGNFDRVISIMCKGFQPSRALARRVIGRLREEAAGAIAAIAMVDELCAPPIEDELDLGAFSHYR
jgi:hypothetical protein